MSDGFDPGVIKKAMVSSRWAAITRLGTTVDAIGQWDTQLIRQTRVLVPIDVQALYVPAGDTTPFVRLPLAVTSQDGQPPADMPAPMAPGAPRPAGVHLHWAPPDALLRGEVRRVEEGSRNRLGLPPLPDRWVVLRILAPNGVSVANVTGWVIEADTAKAVPLAQWPSASAATPSAGMTLTREELTGSAGGSVNWAGVYDAVTNRLAFHDPLTDLAAVAPQGAVGNLAAYVVAGWWSDPKLNPLDGAETSASLHDRLATPRVEARRRRGRRRSGRSPTNGRSAAARKPRTVNRGTVFDRESRAREAQRAACGRSTPGIRGSHRELQTGRVHVRERRLRRCRHRAPMAALDAPPRCHSRRSRRRPGHDRSTPLERDRHRSRQASRRCGGGPRGGESRHYRNNRSPRNGAPAVRVHRSAAVAARHAGRSRRY